MGEDYSKGKNNNILQMHNEFTVQILGTNVKIF